MKLIDKYTDNIIEISESLEQIKEHCKVTPDIIDYEILSNISKINTELIKVVNIIKGAK